MSGFQQLGLIMGAFVLLTGCASIVEGTSQNITVNTSPSGADCGLYREGLKIATVQGTPGSGLVNKTKHDIWVVCVKQGYQMATYFNHSGIAGGTFGNILLGGGVGWAIDSASGADNKYDGAVNMTLVPSLAGRTDVATLPAMFTGGPAPTPAPAAPAGQAAGK
jgi:hypothetical protein